MRHPNEVITPVGTLREVQPGREPPLAGGLAPIPPAVSPTPRIDMVNPVKPIGSWCLWQVKVQPNPTVLPSPECNMESMVHSLRREAPAVGVGTLGPELPKQG